MSCLFFLVAILRKNRFLFFGFVHEIAANLFVSMKVILLIKMGQSASEPEIAVVGTKGQIVIPQRLRNELKITSKTKLIVYKQGDKIVVTKLKVPPLREDLKSLFDEVDKQTGSKKISEKEILKEIQAYRIEKRTKKGA
jgi:AbrB family looped-hinge helix DNA binding protein